MLKRIVCTAGLLAVLGFCAFAQEKPIVSARGAVLMVADTGDVLFAKNEHTRLGMASTTKIMTALLTLEQATPDRIITATTDMVQIEGTSMGLRVGDQVCFRDLVVGMLLPSGNDAANAAALSVAGSIQAFAALMNQKAAQLGMTDTHFVTPSGLDDKAHYSSAYDMALLGCCAMKNPLFVQICAAQKATVHFGNEAYTRTYSNHNRLLQSLPGALGVKTGFTKKSGRCLVSAAKRNGILLVCVTLNDPNDWTDHEKLYEYGFSLVKQKKIPPAEAAICVFGAAEKNVKAIMADELSVPTQTDLSQVQVRVLTSPYCFAPIQKGQVLGCVTVYKNGRCVTSTPLLAETDVPSITEEIPDEGILARMNRYIRRLFQTNEGLNRRKDQYAGRKNQVA